MSTSPRLDFWYLRTTLKTLFVTHMGTFSQRRRARNTQKGVFVTCHAKRLLLRVKNHSNHRSSQLVRRSSHPICNKACGLGPRIPVKRCEGHAKKSCVPIALMAGNKTGTRLSVARALLQSLVSSQSKQQSKRAWFTSRDGSASRPLLAANKQEGEPSQQEVPGL